jgi:hypothetical protein
MQAADVSRMLAHQTITIGIISQYDLQAVIKIKVRGFFHSLTLISNTNIAAVHDFHNITNLLGI